MGTPTENVFSKSILTKYKAESCSDLLIIFCCYNNNFMGTQPENVLLIYLEN